VTQWVMELPIEALIIFVEQYKHLSFSFCNFFLLTLPYSRLCTNIFNMLKYYYNIVPFQSVFMRGYACTQIAALRDELAIEV
jgi:hypothetical protein